MMTRFATRAAIAATGLMICVSTATAAVPTYTQFQLQLRSNIVDGFNVPANSSFNSGTVVMNDARQVAMRLLDVGGDFDGALWFGQDGVGSVVYTSPNGLERLLSDPDMNEAGETAFEQFDFGISDGILVYDPVSGNTTTVVAPGGAFNTTSFSAISISDSDTIGWRRDNGSVAYLFQNAGGMQTFVVSQGSPYSFLATPTFNDSNQIAARVFNNGVDEIRRFNPDGSSILIATSASGPYRAFDNGVDLNNAGFVAFNASLQGGGRAVVVSDGTTTFEIGNTTVNANLSDVEFFWPAINENNLVAFRGKDGNGDQAIFVGDGTELVRLIGKLDTISTDLGDAWIAQNDSSPVFGGGVDINLHGDVAFAATLTPVGNNQIEWGTGVFVARAQTTIPGDYDGNGCVDLSDLGILLGCWQQPCGDITGDNNTDLSDLGVLLGNWNSPCP